MLQVHGSSERFLCVVRVQAACNSTCRPPGVTLTLTDLCEFIFPAEEAEYLCHTSLITCCMSQKVMGLLTDGQIKHTKLFDLQESSVNSVVSVDVISPCWHV